MRRNDKKRKGQTGGQASAADGGAEEVYRDESNSFYA